MMKKVLATTGVLGAALVLTAGPATAAPNVETTAAAASVPGCVTFYLNDSGFTDHLTVYNHCNSGQRIKVVLAKHSDFACQYFPPHTSADYSWKYPARFDRLASC